MGLSMNPAPGEHLLRYVGDRLRVEIGRPADSGPGWRAFLRTDLTRAAAARREIIALAGRDGDQRTFGGASWRDIPLQATDAGWALDLVLTEVGHFRAKAYLRDPQGRQHWPEGRDLGVSVHPDRLRTANTVYCAFPRLFGAGRERERTGPGHLVEAVKALDQKGYAVIPPSGTLRDLTRALPHIFDTLGCGILHLLPIGPTPTTFARMGRYGSPYAQLDLTQIDPALVEFDRRSTAEQQFGELASAVHLRGGLLVLDIVLNHTGWASRLMAERPEWFRREPDGSIHSPGAWGNTWADLAELDPRFPGLLETLAESLLVWCRRGVDGFRCDAGYMVPLPVWQYVIARVREEFPETLFLLEGLGGAWDATAGLLAEGGMQWAYSELFQNFSPRDVSGYLDHAVRMGSALGPLVHFSETHDNPRLASKGAPWSLLRNRLSALASQSGAYGFTCGVEWLAAEKIDVHGCTALRWGQSPHLVRELGQLNALLAEHPCFFDGAKVSRVSGADSWVLALLRESADGLDRVLALVNLDSVEARFLALEPGHMDLVRSLSVDLLGQGLPEWGFDDEGTPQLCLGPGHAHVLSATRRPAGTAGADYRRRRAQAAWAYQALRNVVADEDIGPADWKSLAERAAADPHAFLASLRHLQASTARKDLGQALDRAGQASADAYPAVVRWNAADAGRVTLLPAGHWLLVEDPGPFTLHIASPGQPSRHLESAPMAGGFVVAVPAPAGESRNLELRLERHSEGGRTVEARVRFLGRPPDGERKPARGMALLSNGRGGYARLHSDLGRIESKYDALLAANLHPSRPCDRHVFVKRLRAWAIADGFLTPLDGVNLVGFQAGGLLRWRFAAHAGDGRSIPLELEAWMPEGRNEVGLRLFRPSEPPSASDLRLTLRFDLEDRGFHQETRRDSGLDEHFQACTTAWPEAAGFTFAPSSERTLWVSSDRGVFHAAPEWCEGLPHPLEGSRGMQDRGDAWSPGWFDIPLAAGESALCVVSAESAPLANPPVPPRTPAPDGLGASLAAALPAFLARRDAGATVIAGYPWFLDWGRDTLIACRGLLAAGKAPEAADILLTFAALERDGTLPNVLTAEGDGNRDSSDAPLWLALACEEAAGLLGPAFLDSRAGERTLRQVLHAIAAGYLNGTPNGIRVDPGSGLVWSPAHFTWMDTNHPAGTPREGYPIELQALWIRLLRHLERLGEPIVTLPWKGIADQAERSLDRFWIEDRGFCSDALHAAAGVSAAEALADDHLRPNQLLAVTLGCIPVARARRIVQVCARHLLVPGALRSLAPLPVAVPLPIPGPWGQSLNDPTWPYWGRYEGDEDTRRKPAYHNGTAWVWCLPLLCEALAAAWPGDLAAVQAARACLDSLAPLLEEGCLGQLPEILDGDAPHTARGCDAQAWSVSEALRVLHRLKGGSP
jgi:glycogen debranching enzyme